MPAQLSTTVQEQIKDQLSSLGGDLEVLAARFRAENVVDPTLTALIAHMHNKITRIEELAS